MSSSWEFDPVLHHSSAGMSAEVLPRKGLTDGVASPDSWWLHHYGSSFGFLEESSRDQSRNRCKPASLTNATAVLHHFKAGENWPKCSKRKGLRALCKQNIALDYATVRWGWSQGSFREGRVGKHASRRTGGGPSALSFLACLEESRTLNEWDTRIHA